jgi:Phycobilisome degradation protein nblA
MGHPETNSRSLKQLINLVNPGFQFPVTLTCQGVKVMNQPAELSLEQQFSLCSFKTQVNDMSREQAQEFLVKLYEQMMLRETMYRHFLKHHWGLEPNPGVE